MFRLQTRRAHYALLAVAQLLMTLPNLGAASLWDMDEGVNAEATREMLESGNWITPYFNYELRTAKPALLYWLQGTSFRIFGINESAARVPAVLCGLGTVLITYELARKLFSPTTGLLSAIALASCLEFCLISHAATPDPPLLLFMTGAFATYWFGSEGGGRWWFVPTAALCGLAMLTKGPIGVALPGLIVLVHLIWTRQLGRLWDRRLILGMVVLFLVVAPWYGLVALDTKGKWLQEFFLKENLGRYSTPSEGHKGPFFLHAALLLGLFAPWSFFLPAAIWYGVSGSRRKEEIPATNSPDKYRFLLAWFLGVLVVFSIAATKLPNYVLPLYPAAAILTGRFLDRWRLGELAVPKWVMLAGAVVGVLFGAAIILGLMFASGAWTIPFPVKSFHALPALGDYAALGFIPLVAAIAFGWFVRKDRRDLALRAYTAGAVLFLALAAGFASQAMNDYKVPKHFAEEIPLKQTDRDIRIASCRWLRESMVFYAHREVTRINEFKDVDQFLSLPRPSYVIVPEDVWEYLEKELTVPVRILAKSYDFYARKEILVIANRFAD
jgi:4-amino-4-deoxy-L-arabinose transferase-like glycosyltransferase